MNKEWSLDVLYKGFEDKNYKVDKKKLEQLTKEIRSFSNTLAELSKGGKTEEVNLVKAIDYLEQYQVLGSKINYYLALRQSVNTSDSATANEMNTIAKVISESSKPMAMIQKYIAEIQNTNQYMEKYPKLKAYEYLISEIKKDAIHLLSDDVEEVISKLNISAGSAWSNMHSFLTSTLDVEYRGKIVTLPEVRNMAHSEDAEVRKDAYEAELKAYEKIKDAISYSLNNIKT